ncbi:hypothetical protein TUM4261_16610 [Shewanella sp. c952]|nr:hypothetical protein TUM4261_16610 [Shewanella sp. c952]
MLLQSSLLSLNPDKSAQRPSYTNAGRVSSKHWLTRRDASLLSVKSTEEIQPTKKNSEVMKIYRLMPTFLSSYNSLFISRSITFLATR